MAGDKTKEVKTLDTGEVESAKKKLRYPFQVFFIVGNEFCERFSYYGMRAVLTLYLVQLLGEGSDDTAVALYHGFISLCYFSPVLGAIVADTLLGKFKTILFVSLIYASGNILLSLAATPPVNLPQTAFSFLGLSLIALGTGGIKPCVSSLGGDQFVVPEQEVQLKQFFSVFYFSINAGSLISTILTPEFRSLQCFGMDSCFPLAFGVPAIAMLVAVTFFALGSPLYKKTPPEGNILLEVGGCIKSALSNRRRSAEAKEHWLDYADKRFTKGFVEDVKMMLKVLLLYIPLPIFWSLYDQQGSRWTLQAVQMNGKVGAITILPDQMQVVNALLILLFIPLFEFGVYPLFARCNLLTKALQRMAAGGVLAAVAFIVAGFLEMQLEAIAPVVPGGGEATFTMLNTLPCDVTVSPSWHGGKVAHISYGEKASFENIPTQNDTVGVAYEISLRVPECDPLGWTKEKTTNITMFAVEEKAHSLLIYATPADVMAIQIYPEDQLVKSTAASNGYPNVRLLYNLPGSPENYTLQVKDGSDDSYDYMVGEEPIGGTEYQYIYPSSDYKIHLNSSASSTMITEEFAVDFGGSYSIYIGKNTTNNDLELIVFNLVEPNTINIFWQLPQYFLITAGEILLSITGLEFSFSQAPPTMKSVMSSAFLLTTAFGDLIDVFIVEISIFEEKSKESFLFAGLMFADMVLFIAIAWSYKYRDSAKDRIEQEDTATNESGTKSTPSESSGEMVMKSAAADNPAFEHENNDTKLTEL